VRRKRETGKGEFGKGGGVKGGLRLRTYVRQLEGKMGGGGQRKERSQDYTEGTEKCGGFKKKQMIGPTGGGVLRGNEKAEGKN